MAEIPAGDLTKLRTLPHKSQLYLVVQQPMVNSSGTWSGWLWSAQINGAPAGTAGDLVADLTVDNAEAGPVDLLDGMTVFVGTNQGDHDKGVFRVRGDQTVNGATVTLDIGATSEVVDVIEDDDWVVVLEEFRLWTRYPRITEAGGVLSWYKDYDITWDSLGATDAARQQAMYPPVPVMGPHRVQFVEIGGSVDVDFDWSDSYATADGATVDDWDAYGQDGGAGWSVLNTEDPPAQTYSNVSGLKGYRVRLEVGSDVQDPPAAFRRSIRYVFTLRRPGETQVGDPTNAEPIVDFAVSGLQGSWEDGAWRATITIFDTQADEVEVWGGALVVLFAEDWYGDDKESLGPYDGAENVVFVGRVADGSVRQDDATGDVTFDVLSAAGQARNREMYPIPLENDPVADEWYKGPDLTVDRAAWFYLVWHSTVPLICDWYDSDDTEEIRAIDFLAGDLYSVLDSFYQDRLFARVVCDRYERWKADIDLQMQAAAGGTTSFTLQESDWIGELTFRDVDETPVNIVETGGINYNAGLITPFLAKAPGTVNRLKGHSQSSMNLAIADQATLNTLAGRWLAKLNNRWPDNLCPMAGNWRYPDIWPQEYVNVTQDTVRHDFSSDLFIIRRVAFDHDAAAGVLFTTYGLEFETDGPDGQTIDIPEELPTRPLPPKPYYPPAPPPTPETPSGSDVGRRIIATDQGVFYTDNIGALSPVWIECNAGLSSSDDKDVQDIKRDPHHWWTSGGTERTLWMASKTGVWQMDGFPYGTWTQVITKAALYAFMGYVEGIPFYLHHSRLDFSIEVDGRFSYIVGMPVAAGLNAQQHCVAFVYDSGAISNGNNLFNYLQTIPDNAHGWHDIRFAPHSAGNTIYATSQRAPASAADSECKLWKTTTMGAAWSNTHTISASTRGIHAHISIPYVDALNVSDQWVLWGRAGSVSGQFGIFKISEDSGVTFTDLPNSGNSYSKMGTGGTPDLIFYLADRPDTRMPAFSTDRSQNLTTLPLAVAEEIAFASFEHWQGGQLVNVVYGATPTGVAPGTIRVRLWEAGQGAWQDKTGNLEAYSVTEIRQIDRDSMGTA